MGRVARKKSTSGVYHVIIRGIGKQILFEDKNDGYRFLQIVKKYKEQQEILLYCYCMMENHVHLLICDKNMNIDIFMKKIETSYAFHYNDKYERVGNLFQGRYQSEPVENDTYFMIVFRYILQNPIKSGICNIDEYLWSSYKEYANNYSGITDKEFAIKHFNGKNNLLNFVNTLNNDNCLDIKAPPIKDTVAIDIIRKELNVKSGTALQNFSKKDRNQSLKLLVAKGLSMRQIERLTGISKDIIYRATK